MTDTPLSSILPPIRCTPEQVKEWKRAADADNRPLAQWIRLALDFKAFVTVVPRKLAPRKRSQKRSKR